MLPRTNQSLILPLGSAFLFFFSTAPFSSFPSLAVLSSAASGCTAGTAASCMAGEEPVAYWPSTVIRTPGEDLGAGCGAGESEGSARAVGAKPAGPSEPIAKTKWLRCVFSAHFFLSFSFSLLLHFAPLFWNSSQWRRSQGGAAAFHGREYLIKCGVMEGGFIPLLPGC